MQYNQAKKRLERITEMTGDSSKALLKFPCDNDADNDPVYLVLI